jgi:hypothetical protein
LLAVAFLAARGLLAVVMFFPLLAVIVFVAFAPALTVAAFFRASFF